MRFEFDVDVAYDHDYSIIERRNIEVLADNRLEASLIAYYMASVENNCEVLDIWDRI